MSNFQTDIIDLLTDILRISCEIALSLMSQEVTDDTD